MKTERMSMQLKPLAFIAFWLGIMCCPWQIQAQCVCGTGPGADITPPTLTGVPSNLTVNCSYNIPFDDETHGGGGGSCSGQFTTYTQGGWGAVCNGGNPGCYRDANFAAAFPTGMLLGCTQTLALTTAHAVEVFVPCGGPASVLAMSYVDPNCIGNVLAGQLVAATLSVVFDAYDPNFSVSTTLLGSLTVNSGPLSGLTVNQVLTEANNALGGCGSAYTLSEINAALDAINNNFDNGNQDLGYLDCPSSLQTCGGVTASDNCDPSPDIVCSEAIVQGNCANSYTVIHTWTATDACGNVTTATQTITVVDNTAPVLVGVPADVTASCDAIPGAATVTATDDCGGTPTVTMTEVSTGTGCLQSIVRTWTATDACGNTSSASQTITVSDNVAPVLVGVPANSSTPCGTIPPSANVTATDNCSSNVAVTMTETTTGSGCNQTVVRTWTATDACGNTASASQTITISDNVAPVLVGVPANSSTPCGTIPPPANVTATDNCSPNVAVTMTETTTGSGCNQTVVRTWTATDACGNTTSASQTITVTDNVAPVLVGVPANVTANCNAVPAAATVTATDNCSNAPVVTLSTTTTPGNCANRYTIIRTWTATDGCGNTVSATQVVNVVDNTPPTAICRNITVQAGNNGTATITGADINNGSSDNCSGPGNLTLTVSQSSVTCGTTTVVLTVADQCGNVSSCTASVNVPSGCDVEFGTCPNNIVAACSTGCGTQNGAYVSWPVPTATSTSACPVNTCPTNTYISCFTYLGEFNGHRYYLSSSSGSWTAARASAINNGGYLATINSVGENTFLTNSIGSLYAWIGFNDVSSEGNFTWTGGPGSGYTNWFTGEPNNQTPSGCCGGADYGAFNGDNGNWYDRGDCECQRFIMEIECVSNTCPVTVTRVSGPGPGSFFASGTTTTITYVATTNGTDTDTCRFTVTVGNCAVNYCNSYANCSGYEWIRNVALSNLNNTSGNNGGYEDFMQYTANMVAGQCYALTLRPGFSGSAYNETWKVWIDWNRDGDFNDASEYVFTGSGSGSIYGNVCAPGWATNGSTRMRVSMQYGCNTTGSCGSFSYGEVEDYTVHVGANLRISPEANGQAEGSAEAEASVSPQPMEIDGLEIGTLYPNPVRDQLTVNFTSLRAGSLRIEVLTMDGKIVKSLGGQAQERDNELEMRVDELAAGTYLLKISLGDHSTTEKFVKQ